MHQYIQKLALPNYLIRAVCHLCPVSLKKVHATQSTQRMGIFPLNTVHINSASLEQNAVQAP